MLVLGGALLFAVAGRPDTAIRPVLVAAVDLAAGDVVDASDLRVVDIASDGVFSSVSAAERSSLVGRRARTTVAKGTVLHAGLFSSGTSVPDGQVVVGAALTAGELPVATLQPGDRVGVLDVAESGGSVVAEAVVFDVRPLASQGGQFVSLSVRAADGPAVAEAAAGGRLRLLLAGASG